jgi:hypothetical protein
MKISSVIISAVLASSACTAPESAPAGSAVRASGQSCQQNSDCASSFCEHPTGHCIATGACSTPPECTGPSTDNDLKVCGCDGQTYLTACEARRHDVSVLQPGACPQR